MADENKEALERFKEQAALRAAAQAAQVAAPHPQLQTVAGIPTSTPPPAATLPAQYVRPMAPPVPPPGMQLRPVPNLGQAAPDLRRAAVPVDLSPKRPQTDMQFAPYVDEEHPYSMSNIILDTTR
jgi:hypothetical protein